MNQSGENLLEIVKEELLRLGVQGSQDGQNEFKKSKLLAFTSTNIMKHKIGTYYDSPKSDKNNSHHSNLEGSKTPKFDNKLKKAASKSPFSTKSRIERKSGRKKKEQISTNQLEESCNTTVFCRDLESMELCSTQLHDATLVSVPEFIIDASNLIQKNITLEGIFRKAGSAQRQNEIKKLLNSGKSLPSSVHPIDAACLLKQFLRSLPTPLLSHHVHFLMTRCLELPQEEQKEALSLCSLLLTKPHQDLLVYILELFSCVASNCKENLMDAHNLAIVLAPNLLPISKVSSGKKSVWNTEDQLLCSTIDVFERLIDGASGMCRLSEKLVVAVQNREKSRSLENLTDVPASVNQKKKRRSASIQRIVNGLRRVVQGGGLLPNQNPAAAASPLKAGAAQERVSVVSMEPDVDVEPVEKLSKRKSDTFEPMEDRGEKSLSIFPLEFDRPKKKAKIDFKSSKGESQSQESSSKHLFRSKGKSFKAVKSMVTVQEKGQENVKRRFSLRERKEFPSVIAPVRSGNIVDRRKSFVAVPLHHQTLRVAASHPQTPVNRKSVSPSSMRKAMARSSIRASPRAIPFRRSTGNRPEASSEDSGLGRRGIPDGAETVRRGSAYRRTRRSDPICDLEKRYDEIKSVVQSMEAEVDRKNVRHLKESYFSEQTTSEFSNMSCSQLIHDAYERMKMETRELDCSPSENLSRRLGRELKIRSRRSDQHRVMRSPSERRIGTIRRRSKEMEQNSSKAVNHEEVVPLKVATPKLKAHLLQSPQAGLRRGKPNSLKSGLPVVVKPSSSKKGEDARLTKLNTVCISKRRMSSRNSSNSFSSLGDSFFTSKGNFTDSLMGQYSGPVTRRRSSVLSSLSNPLPSLNMSSEENSFDFSFATAAELEDKRREDLSASSEAGRLPRASSGDPSEAEWISATTFMKDIKDDDSKVSTTVEVSGNRPSIAALKKQKKVTANVQLFSQQIQGPDGFSSPALSRTSRHRRTPNTVHLPLRTANTSRSRLAVRSPLTPLELRRASRSRGKLLSSSSPVSSSVCSPLKEKNQFHSASDLQISTPKIMGKDTQMSRVKRMDTFVLPSGLTPLPPRPYKPSHLLTPKMTPRSLETPPRLPPRSSALSSRKLSPIVNYR